MGAFHHFSIGAACCSAVIGPRCANRYTAPVLPTGHDKPRRPLHRVPRPRGRRPEGGPLHIHSHPRRRQVHRRGSEHAVHVARHPHVVQADRRVPEGRRHRGPHPFPHRPHRQPRQVPEGEGVPPFRIGRPDPGSDGHRRRGARDLPRRPHGPHPRPLPRGVQRVRRGRCALRHRRRHGAFGGQPHGEEGAHDQLRSRKGPGEHRPHQGVGGRRRPRPRQAVPGPPTAYI